MSADGIMRGAFAALVCATSLAACLGGDDAPAIVGEVTPLCAVTAPTSCPTPAPSYADVAPIFSRRCVPCHWGALNGPWPLLSYGSIIDWKDVVRDNLLDCSMPPPDGAVVMEDEERLAILTWLRCGHPR